MATELSDKALKFWSDAFKSSIYRTPDGKMSPFFAKLRRMAAKMGIDINSLTVNSAEDKLFQAAGNYRHPGDPEVNPVAAGAAFYDVYRPSGHPNLSYVEAAGDEWVIYKATGASEGYDLTKLPHTKDQSNITLEERDAIYNRIAHGTDVTDRDVVTFPFSYTERTPALLGGLIPPWRRYTMPEDVLRDPVPRIEEQNLRQVHQQFGLVPPLQISGLPRMNGLDNLGDPASFPVAAGYAHHDGWSYRRKNFDYGR